MLSMCVYMHSRFIENHLIWILEDGPLIYGGGGILSHKTFVRKQFLPCPCDAKDSENIITKKQHSVETK
jgi:hypothetical protein